MAQFTVSQLKEKDVDYSLLDTDLLISSIGTNTHDLSSVQISLYQYAQFFVNAYATKYGVAVAGNTKMTGGLSADGAATNTVNHTATTTTTASAAPLIPMMLLPRLLLRLLHFCMIDVK